MSVFLRTFKLTNASTQFVAYGSDIDYCIVRDLNEHFIVASSRVAMLGHLVGRELHVEATFKGRPRNKALVTNESAIDVHALFAGGTLHGSRYLPPYMTEAVQEQGLPIVRADYVTADSGTGLVHSAPAHGMDDYATWKAQEATTQSPPTRMASYVDADGQYTSSLASDIVSPTVDQLIGMSVLSDAPAAVLEDLKSRNLLVASAKIRHKYPYDWRTKQPVIVRSTPQWFANVEDIKEEAINALQSVNFVPEQGKYSVHSHILVIILT